MSSDAVIARLAAADPAREVVPDRAVAEALLDRVQSSPRQDGGHEAIVARRGARGLVIALALLVGLGLAAAALAAAGVIRFGSPARPSGSLANPTQGLGALRHGTAHVLAVTSADPAGGLAWGMRLLSTTRGVGCLEVGRLLRGRLGVLGRDGAFGNDGRFHQLPAGGLSNGGQCANLDANGRLFYTVSAGDVPASGWQGLASCAPHRLGQEIVGLPASRYCRTGDLRELFYGVLGPEATSVTYRLRGQQHTVKPVGPEGAYLIAAPLSASPTGQARRLLAGTIGSIMPLPWSSPITSIAYRNGTRCLIAATEPGTLKGQCRPPGYRPVTPRKLSEAQVAAPIQVRVIGADHAGLATRRVIVVSFTARVAVTKASSSYEIVEDTSSPEAVFEATQRNIAAGQTVTWRLPAPKPGIYSGKIVLGQSGAPPYPIYTYSPGPLVGRFRVRVP